MFKYLKRTNSKLGDERLFYDESITKLVKETFSLLSIKVTFTENFYKYSLIIKLKKKKIHSVFNITWDS